MESIGFKTAIGTLLALMLGVSQVVCASTGPTETRSDSLRFLQDLRTREMKRLVEINDSLSKRIDEATGLNLDKEIDALKTQQREYQLRQEFLDRLIFQIDTKFSGGDLKAFLERALVEMAKVDAISTQSSDSSLWKFLKYSADALQRIPEPKENVLAFLEGYMNRSILDPVPPMDYLNIRHYTNGSEVESAKSMTAEDAGQIAARRIQSPAPAAPVAPAPAAPLTPVQQAPLTQ